MTGVGLRLDLILAMRLFSRVYVRSRATEQTTVVSCAARCTTRFRSYRAHPFGEEPLR